VPDTLTIRGRSADFRGTLNSRREQSWYDTTLAVIVETIAARNKLTASVADMLKAIPVPHIDQTQESDAVFLSRLADRNGAAVSVKAGKLLLLKAGSCRTARARTSCYFFDTTKERYHQCTNINCSTTFVTTETIERFTVSPGEIVPAPLHRATSGQEQIYWL
jgi:hypothetical protein